MHYLFLAITFLGFLASCGKRITETTPKLADNFIFQDLRTGDPIFLEKQNTSCSRYDFDSESINFKLHLFLSGRDEYVMKNFDGSFNRTLLKNSLLQIISETVYGEEHIYYRNLAGQTFFSQNGGKVVDVCPEDEEIRKNTIESVALNANHYIVETYQKIKKIDPSISLKPLKISVSLSLKEITEVTRTGNKIDRVVMTYINNAFYNPLLQTISFVPHGEEGKKSCFTTNLWEIPSVISHEYGHHVFNSLFKESGLLINNQGCYDDTFSESKNASEASVNFVINSLNEGFADFISHYALPENERGFKGVTCLESVRTVTSGFFPNNNKKIFGEKSLSILFNGFTEADYSPLTYINYFDPHITGAIFAYTSHDILSYLGADEKQKIKIMLDWARRLKLIHSSLKNEKPRHYLKQAFIEMIKVALAQTNRNFDAEFCHKIDENFLDLSAKISQCSI